jgi:lipopolysaccharide transport system permease protein
MHRMNITMPELETLPDQGPQAEQAAGAAKEEIVIRPASGWAALDLAELWRYRELLFFLVWRDVKIRYQQTVLGVAWAFVQPFFTMLVFSLFFGRLAGIGQRIEGDVPYPLFTFAALVLWTLFANSISQSASSLVGSANLIKKVYFPRLVLPLSTVGAGLVDFVVALVTLGAMVTYYGVLPDWRVVFAPAFVFLCLFTSLGAGLWLSALNVQFRDIKHTLPFLVQFWLFATPVAYPSTLVPEQWRAVYGLNPMVGVIEGFRWSLFGTRPAPGPMTLVSLVVGLSMLISGLYFYRRMERTFADVA